MTPRAPRTSLFPYTTLFRSVPRGMRFGELTVALQDVPQGMPASEELRAMVPPLFVLPALLTFPSRAGVLYKANAEDRKSTRLNSSHGYISYAVFCLKKKIRI